MIDRAQSAARFIATVGSADTATYCAANQLSRNAGLYDLKCAERAGLIVRAWNDARRINVWRLR